MEFNNFDNISIICKLVEGKIDKNHKKSYIIMGLIKYLLYKIYFSLSVSIFRIRNNVIAPGLRVKFHLFRKVQFVGNNRIGDNCKIIAPNKSKLIQFYLGQNSWIRDRVEINTPSNSIVRIKSNVSVQDNCKLLGDITIGANSILAPDIFISSGTHSPFHRPYLTIREQDGIVTNENGFISKPITIEEDCWIGKSVFIEPGTHIGKGCVIGSNARIKGFIPPYSVVIKNNIIIKNRVEFNPPSILQVKEEHIPYFYRGFNTSLHAIEKGAFNLLENEGIVILKKKNDLKEIIINGINTSNKKIKFTVETKDSQSFEVEKGSFKITVSTAIINIDKEKKIIPNILNHSEIRLISNEYNHLSIKSISTK